MTNDEINSLSAIKIILKHKGKVFTLMQGTEYYVAIEKQFFINILKESDNDNWNISIHNGCLFIGVC